jgi:hypothetical protein
MRNKMIKTRKGRKKRRKRKIRKTKKINAEYFENRKGFIY